MENLCFSMEFVFKSKKHGLDLIKKSILLLYNEIDTKVSNLSAKGEFFYAGL